jgi:aldehyde dehydrogenase
MTEDLIRSVVQQVLSQMGNGSAMGNGKPRASGNLGAFATADEAVSAADAAYRSFRTRPLADRRKAIDCIR